jgi:hypothetical protein
MRGELEEVRDVADGLWLWRVRHPQWRPGADWDPVVTCTCVESGGEVVLLDALAPPDEAVVFWDRLDANPPTYLAVLLPDHVRDVDHFARRYGISAYGPYLFWRDDVPETDIEPIDPGTCLPGGLLALYDGRGRKETPLWLPEQRALVFGDALMERDRELRVAPDPRYLQPPGTRPTPWHEQRVLPALRSMLELPFEHVIISHGDPLHDRAAFERALDLPPWSDDAG